MISYPYLLSLNYLNQPSLSLYELPDTTESNVQGMARQFGLFNKISIRSSQKSTIFYSKFFMKPLFLLQAALPVAIRGRGRVRVEFVEQCRKSALWVRQRQAAITHVDDSYRRRTIRPPAAVAYFGEREANR
jgi:hypothetical protein